MLIAFLGAAAVCVLENLQVSKMQMAELGKKKKKKRRADQFYFFPFLDQWVVIYVL